MLKRFFKGLVGIALVSLTLASCKKDPNEITATLTVTPDATLTFKAKDNADVVLTVATNADEWKYTADEWILLTKDGDKLTVNVKENNAAAANLGRIKITAGLAQPVSINVYQEAAESTGETPAQGVAVKLNAKSSVDIKTKTETEVTATVSLSIAEAAKKDVEVELFFDNGYLREYNFLNEAEAVLFPEDKVTIPGGGKVVIPAGKTESDDIEIKLDVTTISLGKSYLVPIFVKEVNNATVKQADCRVNILVGKRNPKDVRNVVYIEVNDCNPLNAIEYELEDGTPFIDAVILFAANINYNTTDDLVYLKNNPNVQALLDESEVYLQPLRKKGIKVYLGLLGNHDAAGLCHLADWGAQQWAKEVAEACKTYKLDGVNLDDEYSSSPDLNNKWFASPSGKQGSRLCYELKKALKETCPWETEVSYFAWGNLYQCENVIDLEDKVEHQPVDFIDFYVANYGSSTNPYGGMTMKNCSGMSVQLNYGQGLSVDSARRIKDAGYGWVMWFAWDPSGTGSIPSNYSHSLRQFQNAAEGLYGKKLKQPTGVYNKIKEGKYDPERHSL